MAVPVSAHRLLKLILPALLSIGPDAAAAQQPASRPRLVSSLSTVSHPGEGMFSSDGKRLVTLNATDRSAYLWDVESRRPLRRFEDPLTSEETGLRQVALSPDGQLLGMSRKGVGLTLWSTRGDVVGTIPLPKNRYAWSLAFSPDGRYLAATVTDSESDQPTSENSLEIFEVASRRHVARLSPISLLYRPVFTPDSRHVWSKKGGIGVETRVELYDFVERRSARTVAANGRGSGYTAWVFAESGRTAVAIKHDRELDIWDLAEDTMLRRVALAPLEEIQRVALSPDGSVAVVASTQLDGYRWVGSVSEPRYIERVRVLDTATGSFVRELIRSTNGSRIYALEIAPGNSRAYVSGEERPAEIWDLVSGQKQPLEQHVMLAAAVFSGGALWTLDERLRTILRWDLDSGRPRRVQLELRDPPLRFRSRVQSADGSTIAAIVEPESGAPLRTQIWSLVTGKRIREVAGGGMGISRDGRFVLLRGVDVRVDQSHPVGSNRKDVTSIVSEVATGREIFRFRDDSDANVTLSPDGGQLAIVSGRDVRIMGVPAGNAVWRTTFRDRVSDVAYSADGRLLAIASGRSVEIWAWPGPQRVRSATIPATVGSDTTFDVEFAGPKLLCSGSSSDGYHDAVLTLDLDAGTWSKPIVPPGGSVYAAALSPDGRWLAVAGYDGIAFSHESDQSSAFRLAITDDSAWMVSDAEGRYDSSDPDRSGAFHWVVGDEVIEIKQLKTRFYADGLLRQIWRREPLHDVGGGIAELAPRPDVDVAAPAPGATQLRVTLTNRGGGLGAIRIAVNGKQLPTACQPKNAQASSEVVHCELTGATLRADGRNEVQVTAENAVDHVPSRPRGLQLVTPVAAESSAPPQFHALLVGTSRFGSDALSLQFAARDAASMAAAMTAGAAGLFGADRVHVTLLSSDASGADGYPTKSNITRAFREIAAQARANDTVMLYLAGHGMAYGKDQYFYLTQDATSSDLSDEAVRRERTLTSEEIRQWLQSDVHALRFLVILDTCQAGAAASGLSMVANRRELSGDQVRAMALLKDATGSFVLMGSAADKVSYEASRFGQGLLTYALLQGMRGEAPMIGGRLNAAEWFGHATNSVRQLALEIGLDQQPRLNNGGDNFPVALLTDEAKRAIPVAQAKPQVLQPVVLDRDLGDSLNLGPALREQLRDLGQPAARGGPSANGRIVYLDGVADGVPGALIPRLQYEVAPDGLRVTIVFVRDGRNVARVIKVVPADRAAAARVLAEEIVKAAMSATQQD